MEALKCLVALTQIVACSIHPSPEKKSSKQSLILIEFHFFLSSIKWNVIIIIFPRKQKAGIRNALILLHLHIFHHLFILSEIFIVPRGTQGIKKRDDIFFIVIFSNKLNGECAAYKSDAEVWDVVKVVGEMDGTFLWCSPLHHQLKFIASAFLYPFSHSTTPALSLKWSAKIEKIGTSTEKNQIPIIILLWLNSSIKIVFNRNFFMIQFTDAERSYRSDCETDDGISVANDAEYLNGSSSQQLTARMRNRSPLAHRQNSPFPNEMTNRRMQQYNTAQERLRNGELNEILARNCWQFGKRKIVF